MLTLQLEHDQPQPLIIASKNGHMNVVDLLLDYGADVNSVHRIFGSPLYAGCEIGELRIVRVLLDHKPKADINMKTPARFCYPLHVACINGQDETVDFMIDRGASTAKEGGACEVVLNAACWGCSTLTVHMLIAKGALITTIRGEYGTALEAAVESRNIETVILLLEKGAEWGFALVDACRVGDEAIVKLLIETERKRAADKVGHEASEEKRREQISRTMREFVNITADAEGTSFGDLCTPLVAACASYQPKIVQLLLENGADPNVKGGGKYEYPLLFALYSKDADIIRLLLAGGANVEEAGIYSKELWVQADTGTFSKELEKVGNTEIIAHDMIEDLEGEGKRDVENAEDPVDHLVAVSELLKLRNVGDWIAKERSVMRFDSAGISSRRMSAA